jgi:hypothetical protein
MLHPKKFFRNPFSNKNITDTRLSNFGFDSINKFTAANTDNQYTAIINRLVPPFDVLGSLLSGVDIGLNKQKGKTNTVNGVITDFLKKLSDKEGVIADAVGGRSSGVYLEFFPRGLSEYSNATKTAMPLLVHRIYDAAAAHSVLLGPTLTTELQAFKTSWTNARNAQQQQMGSVEDTRTERGTARTNAEQALLYAIHSLALMFLDNEQACMQFFDFSLLFAQTHKKHLTRSGNISSQQISEILNQSFTNSFEFVIRNTSSNANIAAYLAATAEEQPNGQSKEIKAGRALHIKPGAIGDLAHTFFLIKNLSEVNEASYEIEISGPGIE